MVQSLQNGSNAPRVLLLKYRRACINGTLDPLPFYVEDIDIMRKKAYKKCRVYFCKTTELFSNTLPIVLYLYLNPNCNTEYTFTNGGVSQSK